MSLSARPSPAPLQQKTLCVNAIRALSIDAITKANSGHPGMPLGAAPMMANLWMDHLIHSPERPDWPNRDRFVLSGGHGSMLLYSTLHLCGYPFSMDDIKNFRQWGSKTPGHPEFDPKKGIEATTGPLGQGATNAVGMAIAERKLAYQFNKKGFPLVDHYTYALVTDGDLMEGVTAEAASLAGHLGLGKLIYLYDSNDISLDGPTSLTFTEDVAGRYRSYHWDVQVIEDGDSENAQVTLTKAIEHAKAETGKPSLIVVKTTIGFSSPLSGTSKVHGAPLSKENVIETKKKLNWPSEEPFHVPEGAYHLYKEACAYGNQQARAWSKLFADYQKKYPEMAKQWEQQQKLELPESALSALTRELPSFKPGDSLATRVAGGQVLNAISHHLHGLIGGDADLSCSTNTFLNGEGSFDGHSGKGRNIHFGVREHAMAGIANGIAYHGGLLPFVSTFFCFADYERPSIRLAAMNGLRVIYVWTHDSIGLGEDGRTHQPVEQLSSLRCMPNFTVLRPCDANETVNAWQFALAHKDGPVGIVLTRQNVPVVTGGSAESNFNNFIKGAYIISEPTLEGSALPNAIIIATGSEVSVAVSAAECLIKDGILTRVVSMPCWELFEKQSKEYQELILPSEVTARVSIEAGSTFGWTRWVGSRGKSIGVDRFGDSAPGPKVMEKLGISETAVTKTVRSLLN